MGKRCKKCEHKEEDMCIYWRMWRKDVPLQFCSGKFIMRCIQENVIIRETVEYANVVFGRDHMKIRTTASSYPKIIDHDRYMEIMDDEFGL